VQWHSVQNREVLLEGSIIYRRGGDHARGPGTRGPDSGPTSDPLALATARTTLTSLYHVLLSLKFF